jgi:hypothetical protein
MHNPKDGLEMMKKQAEEAEKIERDDFSRRKRY